MKYKICKLRFSSGLHVGKGMLTDGETVFLADTLFSALCHEALYISGGIEKLVTYCKKGKLRISDGLPFVGETLYIPKPMITIESEDVGNSKIKKAFKKLKYIPVEKMDQYMAGDLDAEKEKEKLESIGKYNIVQKVSVSNEEESVPYFVGSFHFNEDAGLYIVVSYDSEEVFDFIALLLRGLSVSGIGGKRTAGYGRFKLESCEVPEDLKKRFQLDGYREFISLAISLPEEDKIQEICQSSSFQLLKRGGFIASNTYADTYQKKKEIFCFASGSCITEIYQGDIYDVSAGGSHPVYRYAMPLFMGVR